jgi:hypothetical protein
VIPRLLPNLVLSRLDRDVLTMFMLDYVPERLALNISNTKSMKLLKITLLARSLSSLIIRLLSFLVHNRKYLARAR